MPVEDLSQRLLPIVQEAVSTVTPEKMLRITPLIRERIKLLRDVLTAADFFFVENCRPTIPPNSFRKKAMRRWRRKFCEKAQAVLADVEFKHDPLDQALRAAAQELGVKAGQMFQPIRVAVADARTPRTF